MKKRKPWFSGIMFCLSLTVLVLVPATHAAGESSHKSVSHRESPSKQVHCLGPRDAATCAR